MFSVQPIRWIPGNYIFFGPIVSCIAQDNYEIQVYASPTVGKGETIEITHGFTPFFEDGFIFAPDFKFSYQIGKVWAG
jgi:hypothetical protein